jgi:nitrogen fixation/metabolism regulation signal transduction histidine kinase
LRAAIVLVIGTVAFLVGVILMRLMRQNIRDEADLTPSTKGALDGDGLPMHLYNTVIQELKQQKHELNVQSKAEQQRARITETFSQAVLSNLSSGVLVLGANGLVKTANAAAKQILGYASPAGMSAKDIFRGAAVLTRAAGTFPDGTSDELVRLTDEVEAVLREGSGRRQVEAEYESPQGTRRTVAVTISPVPAEDGGLLGVACVIDDRSEMARLRADWERHREASAEKALELRTSLATIAEYARQLRASHDPQQLASDIAQETEQLERSLGSFLRQGGAENTVAAGSGR